MELVREYSAVSRFPVDVSCTCFFHEQEIYCGLSSSGKKLFCAGDDDVKIRELVREYQKIIFCGPCKSNGANYLACTSAKQKNELVLYYLDHHLKEFDVQKLRLEGMAGAEDMWLDEKDQFLYFVFPLSIQKYNLNGDYLGFVMKAPVNTWYKAVCFYGDGMYLAYERDGCAYVAEYTRNGCFKSKFSIGSSVSIGNMEVVGPDADKRLNLYGRKKGQLFVCLELRLSNHTEKNEICVELIRGDGVGETTCYIGCQAEHHNVGKSTYISKEREEVL